MRVILWRDDSNLDILNKYNRALLVHAASNRHEEWLKYYLGGTTAILILQILPAKPCS